MAGNQEERMKLLEERRRLQQERIDAQRKAESTRGVLAIERAHDRVPPSDKGAHGDKHWSERSARLYSRYKKEDGKWANKRAKWDSRRNS